MDIVSRGYQTDLTLLRVGGSTVEDLGDHLVVRTPNNPSFWWGNFLLLSDPATARDADRWLHLFAEAFPGAQHVAIGVDGTRGQPGDLAAYTNRGCRVEALTVMTATSVHPPPRPNTAATYRRLRTDADWAQSVGLRLACDEVEKEYGENHHEFVRRRTSTNRALCEAGHGDWWGAFLDGSLVSQLGLLATGARLARFQSVETSPAHRGSGLAGTLVHHASVRGFAELGARTLVMVADPGYLAIRVYRSVGFVDGETQLQAERRPTTSPATSTASTASTAATSPGSPK